MADRSILETFSNPHPGRDYLIEHHLHEFTSLCPKTGQPDFATWRLRYVPAAACVELKSLKLYMQQFRAQGIFYEDITNVVLEDLVEACKPKWMMVESSWTIRGGIHSVITSEHGEHPLGRRQD